MKNGTPNMIFHTLLILYLLVYLGECQSLGLLMKDDCGQGKVCMWSPANCDPQVDCDAGLTIAPAPDNPGWVDIKMQRRKSQTGAYYVAVGFSKDTRMGDDAVTQCVFTNSPSPSVGLSSNNGKSNQNLPPSNDVVKLVGASVGESDHVVCHVRQKVLPPSNSDKRIFPLNQAYHLLLAYGAASGQNLQFHDRIPDISDVKYNVNTLTSLKSDALISKNTQNKLRKAHGILMIIGWWFFVTVAVIFARYYRPMWPSQKPMGKPIWFQMHRSFNIMGVIVIAAAFICIFVSFEGVWQGNGEGPGATHSILGITCSIIAFVQPLMALIRPHPDGKYRFIFNWVHRFFGVAGWCIAATTIWYAGYFGYFSPDIYGTAPRGMMIFFYVSVVVTVILLEIVLQGGDHFHLFGSKPTGDIQMNNINGANNAAGEKSADPPVWSPYRMVVLGLMLLVSLAVVITLACFIGLR